MTAALLVWAASLATLSPPPPAAPPPALLKPQAQEMLATLAATLSKFEGDLREQAASYEKLADLDRRNNEQLRALGRPPIPSDYAEKADGLRRQADDLRRQREKLRPFLLPKPVQKG